MASRSCRRYTRDLGLRARLGYLPAAAFHAGRRGRIFRGVRILGEVRVLGVASAMSSVLSRQPSNHAMERTADRCTLHFLR